MSINSDRRIGRQIPEHIRREDAAGLRYDSGPYIGKVKNNSDPTRSGRLQVWIPDLGSGDEDDPSNWRTVSYASPFLGSTVQKSPNNRTNRGSKENTFATVRHTYGMWFNVPDLDNLVLCTFVAGDAMRGFWFACIPNQLGHHMIPAIGTSKTIDSSKIKDSRVAAVIEKGQPYPVVEFNEYNEANTWETLLTNKKPIHEPQVKLLIEQGTDRYRLTKTRGLIDTSSQRDTPSGVYGVSTPGRPFGKNPPKPDATDEEKLINTRQGGHTFVMDDGDIDGLNNLTRWRSAGGHQILMDDTNGIFYISNNTGSTWIEMLSTGHINVYSSASINMRTAEDFNLHADRDININAEGSLRIKAKKEVGIETDTFNLSATQLAKLYAQNLQLGANGRLDLSTTGGGSFTAGGPLMFTGKPIGLNSGQGPTVSKPSPMSCCSHQDTNKDGRGQWQQQENKIKSVAKIVPAHEPWSRKIGEPSPLASGSSSGASTTGSTGSDGGGGGTSIEGTSAPNRGNNTPANGGVTSGTGGVVTDSSGNPVLSGTTSNDPGPQSAEGKRVTKPAPASLLNDNNTTTPKEGLGPLTPEQLRARKIQLGYSESNMNYQAENPVTKYIGKYQFGAAALSDMGYIHRDAYNLYGQRALEYSSSWTGRDGIGSKSDFLNSPLVQENVMDRYTRANYNTMIQTGAIKAGDTADVVSGKLSVAHLLGAGGATTWNRTGLGADASGTTGTRYYNEGRYAVIQLARGP